MSVISPPTYQMNDDGDNEQPPVTTLTDLRPVLVAKKEYALITTPVNKLPPDQNPTAVFLASLGSEVSRVHMEDSLRTIAKLMHERDPRIPDDPFFVPWWGLRFQHTQKIRNDLGETVKKIGPEKGKRYSAATLNRHLAALRGVLKAAYKLDHIKDEKVYKLAVDFADFTETRAAKGKRILPAQKLRIFEICSINVHANVRARDEALVVLLFEGLRRAEVAGFAMIDFKVGEVDGGKILEVYGKGRKVRTVPIPDGFLKRLYRWFEVRTEAPGPVICRVDPVTGEVKSDKGVTDQWVFKRVLYLASKAGLTLSPHDFRRTLASELLEKGYDLFTVANILGHASVNTTRRYDKRDETNKIKAMDSIDVPFDDE